ncbi:DUF3667 domain-containing protein [Sphingobacterium sp.]|uniref:DUF3667 domain-containing protein n=1 Tax=Sphingobacterium sp. TaxID=341027 RepID=UPI0028A25FB1|nr:DUF3667 domain-containing protein [Sphingobacterium sp.]
MERICRNCGDSVTKNYCGNCGNNNEITRIDRKYALQECLNLINFDKGFLYTTKGLLLNPGTLIREYISENREKITKPITYLGLTSIIYTLIANYLKVENPYSEMSKKMYGKSSVNDIMIWIQDNYGYANLLMILPITLCTLVFFRKYKYNFYEIFIVISFVMGMGMLIFSIEPILNKLSADTFIFNEVIVVFFAFLYTGWAIGNFYGNKLKNYLKGFLAYVLGLIIFEVVVITSALIYDVIII